MNPKASLKSLKMKVRAIASRPVVSVQPRNPLRADFRASADSRSAMMTSSCSPGLYPSTEPHPSDPNPWGCHNRAAKPVQHGLAGGTPGNHDADVTPRWQEIC